MESVRWGMIGCGAVTEKKSGPGLYKSRHSSLRALYSRNHDRAKDWSLRHGVPVVYETVEALFADPEIDAVYISTPPRYHREYALRCLEAGKIPYIEKPMANSYAECEEILAASRRLGIPVYVAYYRRGMAKYQKLKELVDSGCLGNIRMARLCQLMKPEPADLDREKLPWRLKPEETGGGKFIDTATHALDVIDYLFGSITEVHGMADNFGGLYDVEDTVAAVMRCKSGVLVTGTWCYAADHDDEELLIVGERGHIKTTGLSCGPIHLTVDGVRELLEFPEPEHVAMPYTQFLVDEMTGRGKSPADAESAANNVRVMDAILREYRARY